jgi:hypothetical protein
LSAVIVAVETGPLPSKVWWYVSFSALTQTFDAATRGARDQGLPAVPE